MQRPCEAVVKAAEKLLTDDSKKGNHPSGITIQGLGQFSERGLAILRKFSVISDTKHRIAAEACWLNQINCTTQQLAALQDVLWNRPTTSVVFRCDHKAIDVLSFWDIVEERYIDSFVIDVCISKYLKESYTQGREDVLYFPVEFFQWMQLDNKAFKLRQLGERASQMTSFTNLQQILVPVHMLNHWGLIYINLVEGVLYFDDGLTSLVPSTALPCVKEALNLLLELYPHHPFLHIKFWQSCQSFKRFGIPSQVPVGDNTI